MPELVKASLNKIKLIFLFGIFLFPVLPYAVLSITIGGVILFSLVDITIKKEQIKEVVVLCFFYCILLLSLLYSSNLSEGLSEVQRTLPILILPIALLLSYKKQIVKHNKLLLAFYIISNLVLIGIVYTFLIKGMAKDRIPSLPSLSFIEQLKFLWSYPYEFVREKSIYRIGSSWFINHKTLLAFNFLTAIFFCIHLIFKRQVHYFFKSFLLVASIIFILCIFYTQSLVNVGLILLIPIFVMFSIKNNSLKLVFSIVLLSCGMLLFQKLDLKKAYDNRNTEAAINLLKSIKNGNVNANSDPRLYINYCNLSLIKKAPLLGYGIGDVQDALNNCYNIHQFEPKIQKERIFNSHNYYAHLWLAGGIIACLSFIFMLIYNGFQSLLSQHLIYPFIIAIIAVNLLFDNILLRYSGAVYFGLLNTFLFMSSKYAKNG